MKNLDRLKKQNVRSVDAKKGLTELSLEGLRQVTGGNAYVHMNVGDSCTVNNN